MSKDPERKYRFFRRTDEISSFKTRNMVCAPLKTKDKIIGVLQTINKKNGLFDEGDRKTAD